MTIEDNRRYRGLLAGGAVAYLAFVVYGSLVPLDFTPRSFDQAWQTFQNMPYFRLGIGSRADWVANILLFIPLAFLAAGAVDLDSSWRWPRILSVLVLCLGLSVAIEFFQVFFPPRTVALNDIVAESLGALIGVTLWLWRGPWICGQVLGWARATHREGRALYLLYGYLLVLAVFNLLPLDLTISAHDLYDKWKAGRLVIVPFGFRYASLQDRLVDNFFDVAAWVPAGLLAAYARAGSWRRTVLYCTAIAALLELLQLFVYSRVTDVTDILTAALGCLIGVGLAQVIRANDNPAAEISPAAPEPRRRVPRSWIWATVYAIGVIAALWYPFDFRFDPASFRSRFGQLWAIPLTNLYFQSEFRAISNVALKAGLFAPLGVLLAIGVGHWEGGRRAFAAWAAVLFVVALAFVIEVGQIFLPAKYPDATDIALEAGGAFIAALLVVGPKDFLQALKLRRNRPRWILVYGLCFAGIWIVTHWPGAPYNVRELLRPGLGFLSVALLSMAVPWLLAFPVIAMASVRDRDISVALYRWPTLLVVHAALAYLLIRLAVPEESIADVVGSTVLGGLPELERMGRATVLIGAVVWLLFVGGLVAWPKGSFRGARRQAWAIALLVSAALLPLAHWVVVVEASTDNLTELMREGGGLVASMFLGCSLVLLGATAAWLARIMQTPSARGVLIACALMALSTFGGYWLVSAGTESVILKYGKVFSALQFLLSTDREHYAGNIALLVRFAAAYISVVVVIAIAYREALAMGPRKAFLAAGMVPQPQR